MANRDLSNFRTVTQVEAREPSGLLGAIGELGQKAVTMHQEAKVAENLSAAQLEISQLDNQFRIDNESNPFDAKAIEVYKKNRQDVLGKYSSDISSFFVGDFQSGADKLIDNSDTTLQTWGYKQSEVNTLRSIDNMAQNEFSLMMQHGLEYGRTGQGDLEAMLDFTASKEQLMKFSEGKVGSATMEAGLEDYESEAAISFIEGVANENPMKAKELLESGRFDKMLEVKDNLQLRKQINNTLLKVQKGLQKQEKEIVKIGQKAYNDPVTYETFFNPDATREEIVQNQVARGFTENTASVMTNDQAKLLVDSTITIDSPEEMVRTIQGWKKEFGERFPNAVNDMRKAGLPASYYYMSKLEDPTKIDLLFNATRRSMGKDGKLVENYKIMEANTEDLTNFNDSFAAAFSTVDAVNRDMLQSDSLRLMQSEQARILALSHYSKFGDMDDAIEYATEDYFKGSKIEKVSGSQVPIPEEYDSDLIIEAAESIQSIEPVISAGSFAEGVVARDSGTWVLSTDNKGLQLVSADKAPLRSVSGIIEYSFDDLTRYAKLKKEIYGLSDGFDSKTVMLDILEKKPEIKKIYKESVHKYEEGVNIDVDTAKRAIDKYLLEKVKPKGRKIETPKSKVALPEFYDPDAEKLKLKLNGYIDQ